MTPDHRTNDLVQIKPLCTIFTISIQAFNMKIRITTGRKIEGSQNKNRAYSAPAVFHVNDYARNFRKALGNQACVMLLLHSFNPCITLFAVGHHSPFR